MKCSFDECPHSATLGRTTCTAHRILEDATVPAPFPESPARHAMFYALVIAGAVLLVLAAMHLAQLQPGCGTELP